MNIKEIKELLQLIEEAAIEEFEMERSGVRIRIKKSEDLRAGSSAAQLDVSDRAAAQVPRKTEKSPQENEPLYIFKAPIVGTFFLTPKPDAEPFVQPGERVQKGSVLCIIEAMKLFNQIESDADGEVVRILQENGQPVEYGEPLFEIRLES